MKKNELKYGTILSYVYLAIYMIAQLIYTPILLKNLGQTMYGVYSLCISIVNYFTILDFGLGNAVIRYSSIYKDKESDEKEKLYGFFFLVYLILGLIAMIIGIIVISNIGFFFSESFSLEEVNIAKKVVLILTINIGISMPLSVFSSIVTAYQKFIFLKIMNIFKTLASTIILIIFLLIGYKTIAISIITLLSNCIYLILIMIYAIKRLNIKLKFNIKNIKIIKEIFTFSIFAFLLLIIDKINLSVDMIILGKYSNSEQLTAYSIASRIFQIYITFGGVISSMLLPKFTKLAEQNKTNEINNEFIEKSKWQFLIVIYICMSFIIFGDKFIDVWLGKGYFYSYIITCILMMCSMIPLSLNVANVILQAKNQQKFRSIVLLGILLLNIIISIFFCFKYGALGCTIGTAVTYILGHVIVMGKYFERKQKLNIKEYSKNIFKIVFLNILIVMPIMIIKYAFKENMILDFVLLVMYLITISIIQYKMVLNNKEKKIIINFFNAFKRILNRFGVANRGNN